MYVIYIYKFNYPFKHSNLMNRYHNYEIELTFVFCFFFLMTYKNSLKRKLTFLNINLQQTKSSYYF